LVSPLHRPQKKERQSIPPPALEGHVPHIGTLVDSDFIFREKKKRGGGRRKKEKKKCEKEVMVTGFFAGQKFNPPLKLCLGGAPHSYCLREKSPLSIRRSRENPGGERSEEADHFKNGRD